MKHVQVSPVSFLGGACLATLAFLTMGQKGQTLEKPKGGAATEYRIVDDPAAEDLEKLGAEGWEYAGYLGQGTKGSGNDQTLWKRHGK